ncbi:hypothetical protein [Frankia sp. CiP1_Cm_nod2]
MASKSASTRARSAVTGRFVTAKTAVRHPKTTVVERVTKSSKAKKSK